LKVLAVYDSKTGNTEKMALQWQRALNK